MVLAQKVGDYILQQDFKFNECNTSVLSSHICALQNNTM